MLKNKVALVTGGNRGIGKAISLELAKHGCLIIATYHKDGLVASETLDEINELYGYNHMMIDLDVVDRKDVVEAINVVDAYVEKLDILVNNAGINIPTDFDKIGDEEWNKILDINLKGPFMVMQEALPLLRNGGSIINIASVSGQYGGPRTAHYAASKAGLISLSQVAARFVAHRNIRVNCVSPGLIESPMTQEAGMTTDGILLGRFGLAEEVAKTVAWLASDEASYITGQTINVNGGLYF